MMKANESGMAESREYPVRPGTKDCQFYLRIGRCGYGETCRYNHPKTINIPKCKYFLRGKCKYGSHCDFDHSKEGDGAEHMHQGQKRHRTESRSRSSPSPSPEKKKHREEDTKKESSEAEDNLQEEENLRETQENDNDQQNQEEQRKGDIERQRREACLRLEQIKQTVHFDERIRIRKTLKELGFILTEGDGF